MIKDTWGIDNLPFSILVISMTDKQVLSGKSIRLNIHIGIGHVVDEARLTNIRETSDDESSGTSVDLGQSTEMLSDFLKITETTLKLFQECAHATECSSLEHLCSVERISVLKQTNVIRGDLISDGFCLVYVTQSKFVMVSIIENIHQISIEGMNIIELGEAVDDT